MKLNTRDLERAAKALAKTTGTSDYEALKIVALANINARETELAREIAAFGKDRQDFWNLKDEFQRQVKDLEYRLKNSMDQAKFLTEEKLRLEQKIESMKFSDIDLQKLVEEQDDIHPPDPEARG